MKKFLSLLCVLSVATALTACGLNKPSSKVNIENSTQVEETTVAETTQEVTVLNHRDMSNEELAVKLAEDFSTNDVTFTSEKSSDDMYFLKSNNDKVKAHIGFSDYGKNITLSFVTDGGEDECYYVLLKALQSEIFNIPFDDQIDILADYTISEIDYKNGSFTISETVKDNIRVIGIRLQ